MGEARMKTAVKDAVLDLEIAQHEKTATEALAAAKSLKAKRAAAREKLQNMHTENCPP